MGNTSSAEAGADPDLIAQQQNEAKVWAAGEVERLEQQRAVELERRENEARASRRVISAREIIKEARRTGNAPEGGCWPLPGRQPYKHTDLDNDGSFEFPGQYEKMVIEEIIKYADASGLSPYELDEDIYNGIKQHVFRTLRQAQVHETQGDMMRGDGTSSSSTDSLPGDEGGMANTPQREVVKIKPKPARKGGLKRGVPMKKGSVIKRHAEEDSWTPSPRGGGKSPKRKSKRKSTKRKSPKRKSPKRKSPKRKSTKRR
jgi:hypothetical protein